MRDDSLRAQEHQRLQQLLLKDTDTRPTLRSATAQANRAPVPDGEAPCFALHALQVAGPSGLDFWPLHTHLQDEFAGHRGKCIGHNGIQALLHNLRARMQESGWVTSQLEVQPQNLQPGVLSLHWSPGTIASVSGQPSDFGRSSLPLRPGQVVTVAALDQSADLLNRLPSIESRLLVQPTGDPRQHDVVLQWIARRPWRAALTLDNTSSREYGRTQATIQLGLDRPSALLGVDSLLDQAGLFFSGNAEKSTSAKLNEATGWNYSIPFGNHLLGFSAQHSRFARPVRGTSVTFLNRGADRTASMRWTWTAWRDAQSKWAVWAEAGRRSTSRHIDDVELVLQRQRTRRVEAGISMWRRSALAVGVVDWSAEAGRAETHKVDAQQPFEMNAKMPMTEHHASWGASTTLPIEALSPRLNVRVAVRSVRSPLSGSDLPMIGTRFAVRGFDGETPLQGRHTATLRSDLEFAPSSLFDRQMQVQPFAGLDFGVVRGEFSAPAAGRTLAGLAMGLRAQMKASRAEIELARPMQSPKGMHPTRWVPTLSLTIDI